MSKTIDERVVEMQFDNAQFEKNVETSISTLDRLKQSLRLEDSAQGFVDIDKAANNVSFDSLVDGVSSLEDRFSILGIVGMRVIQNLTDSLMDFGIDTLRKGFNFVTEGIVQGGIRRAMNIENAHFQLQGLLKDEEQVQAVLDDAMWSVNDTAYAYDSAAKAAANFATSNVKAGEDMRHALRGITGVAAVTNSAYDDIANLFTVASSAGRLTGDVITRFTYRGLNVAATLKDYINGVIDGSIQASDAVTSAIFDMTGGMAVAEENIKDFAKDGAISFSMFAEAMDTSFGEHAKKANETLNGIVSNLKASLAKIGALFISPLIEQNGDLVQMLNTLKDRINDFKGEIGPIADVFVDIVKSRIRQITKFLEGLDVKSFAKRLSDFVVNLQKAAQQMKLSDASAERLKTTFKGVFAIIGLVKDVVMAFLRPLKSLFKGMAGTRDSVLAVTGTFGDMAIRLREIVKESGVLEKITSILSLAFEQLGRGIALVFEGLKDIATGNVSQGIRKIFEGLTSSLLVFVAALLGFDPNIVKDKIKSAFDWLSDALPWDRIGESIKSGFQRIQNAVVEFSPKATEAFNNFKLFMQRIGDAIAKVFDKFKSIDLSWLKELGQSIQTFFGGVYNFLKQILPGLSEFLGELLTRFGNVLRNITFQDIINVLKDGIKILAGIEIYKGLKSLHTFIDNLNGIVSKLSDLSKNMKKKIKWSAILSLALSLGVLVLAIWGIMKLMERPEGFNNALAAVGSMMVFMLELVMMLKMMTKLKNTEAIDNLGPMLLKLSFSMLVISFAIKNLANIDPGTMLAAAGALGALMVVLMAMAKFMDRNPADKNAIWNKLYDFKSDKIAATAKQLVALSVAVLVLSFAIRNIAAIDDLTQALKAVGLVGVIIVELVGAMAILQFMGKFGDLKGAASSLLAMSIAVGMLVLIIKMIAKIRPADAQRGLTTIIQLLLGLAVAMGIIEHFGGNMKMADVAGMLVFVMGVSKLSKLLEELSKLSWDEIIRGIVGLTVVVGLMVGSAWLMSKTGDSSKSLLMSAAAMVALALAISMLGKLNVGTLALGLGALAVAFGIIIGFSYAMKGAIITFMLFAQALKNIGLAVLAFGGGIALLALGMNKFIKYAAEFGKAVVAFLISILEGLPEILAALFRGLADSVDELREFLISLVRILCVTLVEALGILDDYTADMVELLCNVLYDVLIGAIRSTARKMDEIVAALRELFDAFIEAITTYFSDISALDLLAANGMLILLEAFFLELALVVGTALIAVAPLPLVGLSLKSFANTIKPFFEIVKDIDPSLVDNARAIADMIIAFAGGSLLGAVSSFLAGSNELEKIGRQLAAFAPYYKEYADTMSKGKFDADLVTASANAGTVLVEMAKCSKSLKGVNKNETLTKFGEELAAFAPSLASYANTMSTAKFDAELVTASANAGAALAEMASIVPPYIQEGAWASFAEELAAFAPKFVEYAQTINVNDVDMDLVTRSAAAAGALAKMASELPNIGGWSADIFGDNTLTDFAEGLATFAPAFALYANIIGGQNLDFQAVEDSVGPILALINMAKEIPNSGGWSGKISGENDLSDFAQELADFAPKFGDFVAAMNMIGGVNAMVVVESSAAAIESLVNVADRISVYSGTNVDWLTEFGQSMADFAPKLVDYIIQLGMVTTADMTKVEASATAAMALGNMVNELVGKQISNNVLGGFGEQLESFGPHYAAYASAVGGIGVNFSYIEASASPATALGEMVSSLSRKQIKNNVLGGFGEQLAAFGPMYAEYANAIAGVKVNAGFIDTSTAAIQKVADMVASLSKKQIKNDMLGKFGEQLAEFGPQYASYAKEVGGIGVNFGYIESSAHTAFVLAQVLEKLTQKKLNNGVLSKFGEELAAFAPNYAKFSNEIAGIKVNSLFIETSATAIGSLADVFYSIPEIDKDIVINFGKSLYQLGYYTKLFSDQAVDFNIEGMESAVSEINKLIDLATSIESVDTEGVANFSKSFTEMANGAVDNLVATFATNGSAKVIVAIKSMITAMINTIKSQEGTFKLRGAAIVDKLIEGIKSKIGPVKNAFSGCLREMAEGIRTYYNQFRSAGSYLVSGFVKGIDENTYRARAAARAMAAAAEESAKAELEQNSPSKKFYRIGVGTVEGMVNAMNDGRRSVYKSGTALAEASIKGTSEAIKHLAAWMESDIDTQPTIRPVMDLTDVEAGARRLNSMLSTNQAYGIAAQMRSDNVEIQNGSSSGSNSFNFVQNNYSPKALSSIEIYRQTRNQISKMKGLIGAR